MDYVLGDGIGFVDLQDHMGNDGRIVESARVSFNNDKNNFNEEKDGKLIKYLLKNNHSSPFEHVVFSFHVKAPLFVVRQWQRHRTFSYNEISRRYTSEDIDFYIPRYFRKQSENNRQASTDDLIESVWGIEVDEVIKEHTENCFSLYENLLDAGVSREQARMMLPQNMYTRFYVTGNLWNFMRFIKLRDDEHAQWEIRQYAKSIRNFIFSIVPVTMNAWSDLMKHN